jgi:NADH:ubiquinone oxidoreductase subunit F (NADH-binding)
MASQLKTNPEILQKMIDEASYMARTSLCPLGQSPVLPLKSFERYFATAITNV